MNQPSKKTIVTVRKQYEVGEPIVMLTAFDYLTANWLDQCGVDIVLVGDSLGMTFKGEPNTLSVTVEEMAYHTRVVARGAQYAMVVADMPFLSYQTSAEDAIRNCGMMLKQAGAHAVKMEGGLAMAPRIRAVVDSGIPVMGHIGMQPQQVMHYGGFPVVGKDRVALEKLWEDAKAVQDSGVFALVIESVPAPVAKALTSRLRIPTIGIGAGSGCSGQVLVTHDLLGFFTEFKPKFVKRYAELAGTALRGIGSFVKDVRDGGFPDEEHSYGLKDESLLESLDEIFS